MSNDTISHEEHLAVVIARAIADAVEPVAKRVASLEKRCAELEARPVAKEWRGLWQPDQAYQKGDRVSAPGGSWIALMDSRGRKPGESASCWFLEIKNGRDGRDGKDAR